MGTCLRESIRRLQQELNKEIEKLLNEEIDVSSQSVMKISQKLDLLIVQDLKEKLKVS